MIIYLHSNPYILLQLKHMSIWLVTEAHFVSLGYLWPDHFQLIAFTLTTSDYFLYFYKPMMFAG